MVPRGLKTIHFAHCVHSVAATRREPHGFQSIFVRHLSTLQVVISGTARIKHTDETATRKAIAQKPQACFKLMLAVFNNVGARLEAIRDDLLAQV